MEFVNINKEDLYKIKSLNWEGKLEIEIQATTRFCSYHITKKYKPEPNEPRYQLQCVVDGYCYDDYIDFKSVIEAKKYAEKHWLKEIKKCLLEIE